MIKLVVASLIFAAYTLASNPSSTKLTGDHICQRQENYSETINSTTSEPIQIRKNFWCLEKIRCSELQSEFKEVVHFENVTKNHTVDFCCPGFTETQINEEKLCKPICKAKCINGYCENPEKCTCRSGFMGDHCDKKCPSNKWDVGCEKFCKCGNFKCNPETGECLKEKLEPSTSTPKPNVNDHRNTSRADPFLKEISPTAPTIKHNPYSNYSGEYGKEFNHYVKMSMNESDVQESINKIVDMEIRQANEELRQQAAADGFILFDISENELNQLEPLKHPQYVTDHHIVSHHDESIAMVTVGCLILGMLVFLLAMVYIRRITRRVPKSKDLDPEAILQRVENLNASKIVHEPLPIPPLRPSLRKTKSVTFDESIDEVDEMNRKRAKSLPDTYDVPRKQSSMMDLYAQSVKITPKDIVTYEVTQKPFNTFPRQSVSRKQSMEHIYDEIPIAAEIANATGLKLEKNQNTTVIVENDSKQNSPPIYANDGKIENTKM